MVLVAAQGFGWALLIAALMLALCIVWLWCRHVARSAETRNPPHISDGT
jgi:hypothetical protein